MRLTRLFGNLHGRALEETLADVVYEVRAAPTLVRRIGGIARGLAAAARIVFHHVWFFEEPPMRHLGRDLAHAVRRLRHAPGFALFAVATLALGIGITTAVYSIVHALLGPTPGVTTMDRLVTVNHYPSGSIPMTAFSYGDYLDLRANQSVFEDVAGWSYFRGSFVTNHQAETNWCELVSGEYFTVLGVKPALGRLIQPSDDTPSSPPVAVIGDSVWRRLFDRSPDAVGQVLKLNGASFEIVGVVAAPFEGLFNHGFVPSAVWVPIAAIPRLPQAGSNKTLDPNDRSHHWVQVRARLVDGVSAEQAQAQVTAIGAALDRAEPIGTDLPPQFRAPDAVSRPWVVRRSVDISMNEASDRLVKSLAAMVMAGVGLVLLVVCSNVANLMLARGGTRRHDLSVRLALGASRGRLVREVGVEGTLLVLAGGLVGLGVARMLLVALGDRVALFSGTSLHVVPQIDAAVFAVTGAATLAAILVAALAPALQSSRTDVRSALAGDGAQSAVPRWRGRRLLVAAQVAVSMLIISIAALCLAQLGAEARRDTGVDLDRVAAAQVDFASQRYEPARAAELVDATMRLLARRPDVESVAASSGLAFGIGNPGCRIGPDGPGGFYGAYLAATPDIFRTLGVSIVHGRAFTGSDSAGAQPVAILSEQTARRLFGRTDVVGQLVRVQRRRWAGEPADHPFLQLTIVGVASDTDSGAIGIRSSGTVYVPLAQQYQGNLLLLARTSGDPQSLVGPLRRAIASVDPEVAVTQVDTAGRMAGITDTFLVVISVVSSALGTFALVLALVGLVGVLSHLVARRTREIGLRMALGATRERILRMVLRDGLRPVAGGIILGLALGAFVRVAMRPLYDRLLPAFDPWIAAAVPLALLAAGAVACYLPARRAARIDPHTALRDRG